MEQPLETQKVFRCLRCQHVEIETVSPRQRCPRCGLPTHDPRTERERLLDSPGLRLELMRQPL